MVYKKRGRPHFRPIDKSLSSFLAGCISRCQAARCIVSRRASGFPLCGPCRYRGSHGAALSVPLHCDSHSYFWGCCASPQPCLPAAGRSLCRQRQILQAATCHPHLPPPALTFSFPPPDRAKWREPPKLLEAESAFQ